MARTTRGLRKVLGVMDQRRQVAERYMAEGRCQIKDCPNPAAKIVDFVGHVLCLCEQHRKMKGG